MHKTIIIIIAHILKCGSFAGLPHLSTSDLSSLVNTESCFSPVLSREIEGRIWLFLRVQVLENILIKKARQKRARGISP